MRIGGRLAYETTRKMQLTVIIPLHNCADSITYCLQSIDRMPDMEIIVVDDGSTDSSADIVQRYAADHPEVKLVRKSNGGVSSARNRGLDEAKGDYLMFVDADDYLATGALPTLLGMAKQTGCDVLKYRVAKVEEACVPDKPPACAVTGPVVPTCFSGPGAGLKTNQVSDYHVVDALFRRELIGSDIRFHEELYLHEDDVSMAEVYAAATLVVRTDVPLYQYVFDSSRSHTHKPTAKQAHLMIDSALAAVRYRRAAVQRLRCTEAESLERLKQMRYVYSCHRIMLDSDIPLDEQRRTLACFKPYGCYPLRYRWMDVCLSPSFKLGIKTFLCNHPTICSIVHRLKMK